MIFKINSITDDLIQSAYDEAMMKFNDFWGVGWDTNTPYVIVVENREDFDVLLAKKTENWTSASAFFGNRPGERRLYVLDFKNINQLSSQKYDENGYKALIRHELCHLFYKIVSKGPTGPAWLSEGASVYLSGQNDLMTRPNKFDGFIEANGEKMAKAYNEGGYVVEMLVTKFGKEKFIKLISSLSEVKIEGDFDKIFEGIYGFKLNYETINGIYLENK